jgi:hypothetical protein
MSEASNTTPHTNLQSRNLVQLLDAEIRRLRPIDLIAWSRQRGDPVLTDSRTGEDYLPGYHPDD